jgi:putative transposase
VRIRGKQLYLWRAVDQDGEVVDVFLQARREGNAAKRFFKRLLTVNGGEPRKMVTDKLERGMRRFKSMHEAQRFLGVHSAVQNLFHLGRHLISAQDHRMFRQRAFASWECARAS